MEFIVSEGKLAFGAGISSLGCCYRWNVKLFLIGHMMRQSVFHSFIRISCHLAWGIYKRTALVSFLGGSNMVSLDSHRALARVYKLAGHVKCVHFKCGNIFFFFLHVPFYRTVSSTEVWNSLTTFGNITKTLNSEAKTYIHNCEGLTGKTRHFKNSSSSLAENILISEVNGRMVESCLHGCVCRQQICKAALWRYHVSLEQVLWGMFQALY